MERASIDTIFQCRWVLAARVQLPVRDARAPHACTAFLLSAGTGTLGKWKAGINQAFLYLV
ncbi:hypothetical protein D3C84_1122770 [compost metagenome]